MSESERRRKYRYDRVLIETARVLSSTFDDAVVYLSGVQLEMLRNVTQYLRRLDTYVTEYNPGYYLTPTSADYDDILAIVSDLEETLMGNPNTIWGYNDTLRESKYNAFLAAGDTYLYASTVPAEEVWRILGVSALVVSGSCTKVEVRARIDGVHIWIDSVIAPTSDVLYTVTLDVVLKAGDYIYLFLSDMTLNDDGRLFLWGYKMAVPA